MRAIAQTNNRTFSDEFADEKTNSRMSQTNSRKEIKAMRHQENKMEDIKTTRRWDIKTNKTTK